MGRPVLPQRRVRKKTKARYKPKHRQDGTFKVVKAGKYNAQGRYVNDIWFASKSEANRYLELIELEKQGRIERLELQKSFRCMVKGVLVTTYRCDFAYDDILPTGQRLPTIEDVKGMETKEYKIKKKLVEALFDVTIKEIPAGWVLAGRTRFATASQLLAKEQ